MGRRWSQAFSDGAKVLWAVDRMHREGEVALASAGYGLRRSLRPSTEEEFRRERLAGLLLGYPDAEAAFDGGRGTVMVDRGGKAIALGWGWDAASDLRIDRIDGLDLAGVDLIVRLPAPWQALRMTFASASGAERWKEEFSQLG